MSFALVLVIILDLKIFSGDGIPGQHIARHRSVIFCRHILVDGYYEMNIFCEKNCFDQCVQSRYV
jgi:hypothetical protein